MEKRETVNKHELFSVLQDILSKLDETQEQLNTLRTKLEHEFARMRNSKNRQMYKDEYRVDEFARLVKRTEGAIRRQCRQGTLNHRRGPNGYGPHPAYLIPHSEYERWVAEGRVK